LKPRVFEIDNCTAPVKLNCERSRHRACSGKAELLRGAIAAENAKRK